MRLVLWALVWRPFPSSSVSSAGWMAHLHPRDDHPAISRGGARTASPEAYKGWRISEDFPHSPHPSPSLTSPHLSLLPRCFYPTHSISRQHAPRRVICPSAPTPPSRRAVSSPTRRSLAWHWPTIQVCPASDSAPCLLVKLTTRQAPRYRPCYLIPPRDRHGRDECICKSVNCMLIRSRDDFEPTDVCIEIQISTSPATAVYTDILDGTAPWAVSAQGMLRGLALLPDLIVCSCSFIAGHGPGLVPDPE